MALQAKDAESAFGTRYCHPQVNLSGLTRHSRFRARKALRHPPRQG